MSTTAPVTDQFQYVKMPDGSYGKFAANASDDVIRAAVQKDFPDAYKTAKPGLLNTMKDNFNAATQGAQPGDSGLKGFIENIGQGGGQAIHGLANMIQHPLDTAHREVDAVRAGPKAWLDEAHQEVDAARADPSRFVGNSIGQLGTGAILGEAGGSVLKPLVNGAGKMATAARTAAIGDEDAAALRGLRVPASGKKVLPMQSSVQNARPYLQGASSLEDLQTRVPTAKNEVFQPYKDTIDAVGDNPVKGPDGMTTIRALDNERQELSAMNRGLKTGDPSALRLAEQKGLSQADSLAREKAIKSALFPELSKYGIDPQGIMKDYGSLSRIGNQIEGRSTLLEKPQAYGFAKAANPFELTKGVELTKPSTYVKPLSNLADAGKDIAAGRYWTASPTDVGIRQGFANAGPKPDFGRYTPFQPMGQLEAPAIELGSAPEVGGTPEGYRPPNFYHDTTAMRTGRLLNAPPIELGGAVEGPKGTAFRYDTTPMRQGRILPSSVSDDVPLSSHSDIFPDQRPGATRAKPKVIEARRLKDLTGK